MVSNSGSYRGHQQEKSTYSIFLATFLSTYSVLRIVSWLNNPERDLVISHQTRG
jgi:hypothetical protein